MKFIDYKKNVLILCILFICTGCSNEKSISSVNIQTEQQENLVLGADGVAETYSVSDQGIVYSKDNHVKYYDFSEEEAYILCGRANCTHNDENCSAWCNSYIDTVGYALYQDRFYLFRKNTEENTYDFISMDVTGNNQKVITQIDIGEAEEGAWIAARLYNVYYYEDMAWISVNYQYVTHKDEAQECVTYMGINLHDGKISRINEPALTDTVYSMQGIVKGKPVLLKREANLKILSESEFESEYESGTFAGKMEESEDLYYDYLNIWYPRNCGYTDTYIIYEPISGKETMLETAPAFKTFDDNDNVTAILPKYIFLGEYNGNLLCEETDYTSYEKVFLWDIENKKQEEILRIEEGGLIATESGSILSVLYDSSKFLYCLYTEDERAKILEYDISERESRKLFEDERNISFRIVKEAQDVFIGKIYSFTGKEMKHNIYAISKEDYYKGNIKDAKRLKL